MRADGCYRVRRARVSLPDELLAVDAVLARADTHILQSGARTTVGAVTRDGAELVLKRFHEHTLARVLETLALGSGAARAWRGAARLADAGFEAPEIVAVLERRRFAVPIWSCAVIRHVAGPSLDALWRTRGGGAAAIARELPVVAGDDERRAAWRLAFPDRQQLIDPFATEAGADAEDDRLLGRDGELAPHGRALTLAPSGMEAGHVDAVAHDHDVARRHLRVRRQNLVAGARRHRQYLAIRPGRVLPALEREQHELVGPPAADAAGEAAGRREPLDVAAMAAAARAKEIVADGASEANYGVGIERAPHARREGGEREQLRELSRAHDRHAVQADRFRHRHATVARHDVHLVPARGEPVRELPAIRLGAAEPVVALVDERDPHSTYPSSRRRRSIVACSSALSAATSPADVRSTATMRASSARVTSGCSAATLRRSRGSAARS